MDRRRVILTGLAAWAVLAVGRQAGAAARRDPLEIVTATGRHRFQVELAATQESREQGLMYRTHLPEAEGMLFDFGVVRPVTMWMKNTLIPLDMLFLSAAGEIVRIEHRAEPHSLTFRSSGQPVRAVLELAGGVAARLGLQPGDRVIHPVFSP